MGNTAGIVHYPHDTRLVFDLDESTSDFIDLSCFKHLKEMRVKSLQGMQDLINVLKDWIRKNEASLMDDYQIFKDEFLEDGDLSDEEKNMEYELLIDLKTTKIRQFPLLVNKGRAILANFQDIRILYIRAKQSYKFLTEELELDAGRYIEKLTDQITWINYIYPLKVSTNHQFFARNYPRKVLKDSCDTDETRATIGFMLENTAEDIELITQEKTQLTDEEAVTKFTPMAYKSKIGMQHNLDELNRVKVKKTKKAKRIINKADKLEEERRNSMNKDSEDVPDDAKPQITLDRKKTAQQGDFDGIFELGQIDSIKNNPIVNEYYVTEEDQRDLELDETWQFYDKTDDEDSIHADEQPIEPAKDEEVDPNQPKLVHDEYDNGNTEYDGYKKNNMKEGWGTYYDEYDYKIYEGNWEEDHQSGFGTEYFEDGKTPHYVGTFKLDELNGEGFEYRDNGTILYEGEFKEGVYHGIGARHYKKYYGIEYEGNWEEGRFQGQGEKYYENAELMFCGCYADGILNGQGEIQSKEGKTQLKGHFDNGKLNKHGTEYYNEGPIEYEGNFKDNLWHGKGVKKYFNGKISYDGNFEEGKAHGSGIKYHENGKKEYEGFWKNGMMHGVGKLWDDSGVVIHDGKFCRDKKYDASGKLIA